MGIGVIILLIVVAVIVVWFIATYNGFINLKNKVENGWAQIDVQLKRRYDLIPNLLETVKGYAAHEKEIFEHLGELRAKAMGATSVKDIGEANNQITQTLKSLLQLLKTILSLRQMRILFDCRKSSQIQKTKLLFQGNFTMIW